ncbi:MAG: hypothetical protein KC422_24515 [Trueperaceae bacterium]|nr:hypothetical protein [Trueperaceae bacterium]
MKARKTLSFLIGMLLIFLACASAQELTYTYENGTLTGPQTISVNGYQNILFVNNSDMELDVTFAKLHEGATLAELETADKAFMATIEGEGSPDAGAKMGTMISLADFIGGVHPVSHTQASAYLKLEPGNYIVNASTGGGGDPYMPFYLEVAVTEGPSAEAPSADFNLHMSDFHFDFPDTMPAGKQVWQISDTGSQPHMALVWKLMEGKTAEDVTTWMSDFAGPPPVEFEGGGLIQGITAGQTFYIPIELSSGNYVVVCPLPNLGTGEPHFADGMIATFKVE